MQLRALLACLVMSILGNTSGGTTPSASSRTLRGARGTASGNAHGYADDWSDWECPGFPCFIVNQYDSRNTTASRVETCGPIADDMSDCLALMNGQPFGGHAVKKAHPCTYGLLSVCDQSSCLQGSVKECQKFCAGLLADYQHECNNACTRYCPS